MKFQRLGRIGLKAIASTLPELIGLGGFLAVWQLGAWRYSSVILPSPLETLTALKTIAADGELMAAIMTTTVHALGGFFLAATAGIILGIVSGIQPFVNRAIAPGIAALQGIPPIAWIVLALLWFGTGNATPIFTVSVATLPIIFIGAVEGVQTIEVQLLEMVRSFKVPPRIWLEDLYFPHLLSSLFPAIAAGLGLAWRVAIMSELLSSETGIGAQINLARINLETEVVMAWIIVVVLLILTSEYLVLRPLKHWLEPWRRLEKVQQNYTLQSDDYINI